MIWFRVTPLRWSRSGSTRTWSCRSRLPQMETLATPGTPMSRGLITQRARTDISIGVSSSDVSLSMATLLLDDSGWIIWGVFATAGRPATPTACVSRSWTTCLASRTFVPGSNVITTDDSPGRETDSISSRKGTPTRRSCSSGTVISCSTSAADRPSASVWTSTVGGWNSGSVSTLVPLTCTTPRTTTPAARTRTSRRSLRLESMSQRMPTSPCPASPVRQHEGDHGCQPVSDHERRPRLSANDAIPCVPAAELDFVRVRLRDSGETVAIWRA